MRWDSIDVSRTSRNSDVAFWLHLLAAPLIIHPIFTETGILEGNHGLVKTSIVVSLYLVLTLISIVIDRRAIMVSALSYVVYALYNVIELYGEETSYPLALAGLIMGAALLVLSAFWQQVRSCLYKIIPDPLRRIIPAAKPPLITQNA